MAKLSKKERELLKNEIQMKNVMTRQIIGWTRRSLIVFLFMLVIIYWGFFMNNDILISAGLFKDILKWLAVVVAVISFVFAILTYLSFRNSKKHVFALIDKLESNK